MLARLRKTWQKREARRIIRGLDLRVSDDPLIEAFRQAKARGRLSELVFWEYSHSRRGPSWRDRWIDMRLGRAGEARPSRSP